MAFAYVQTAGNGSNRLFSVPFPFLLRAHVKVFLNYDVVAGTGTELVDGTGFTWLSDTQIQTTVAPAVGATLTVIRKTPNGSQLVDWDAGSPPTQADLNTADLQSLYVIQEQADLTASAVTTAATAATAANAAVAAVAAALPYQPIAAVANIPASPTASQRIEISNTTGLESFSPLSGKPAGFVGGTGVKARLIYGTPTAASWNWVDYFPVDPDGRYAGINFTQSGAGALARTVTSKLQERVSVKDFGAVGDGVADDRARFALADSSAPAGAALYIPPGTYRLDGAALTINRKVVAYGATFTGTCQLSMPLMETSSSNVNRLGSYAAVGTPVDFGGGKGGVLVGGGNPRSTNGTYLSCDGATNWLSVLPSKNYNPQEVIIYGSAAQGYATTVNGTAQITKVWGSDFNSAWIGRTIYFLRKKFKVATVSSTSSLTVTELDGSSVTFSGTETEAYNFFYTSGSGICNVSGTTVTFVSGDPFVPLFFSDFEFRLNGVLCTVASFDSVTQYTLSTAPGNGTSIPFTWSGNINDQLTTLRVQAIQGENEENVNLLCRAGDNFLGRYYGLEAGFAGAYGTYRPIYMGSGNYTDFTHQHQIGLYPRNYLGSGGRGYVSLGGVQGREGFRVYSPNASTVLANRLSTQGAATTFTPSIRAEGSDTNINLGLDAKGTGNITITQDFSRPLLRVFGVASAVNHPTISNSGTGDPVEFAVSTDSSDTDVDIRLAPKGAGVIRFGTHTASTDTDISGYVTIKDASGNTRKLAIIT